MNKKLLQTISCNEDIISKLNKNTYMRRNNIAEDIEVYFAVNLNLLEDMSKLNKLDELYEYIDYEHKDDIFYNTILNNYVGELQKKKMLIETVCLITPKDIREESEEDKNLKDTRLSLTMISHDNEEDIFGKFFRKPEYYQNKKSKYKMWAITEYVPLRNYFDIIYLLDKLRIQLMLNLRIQLKKKNRNLTLDLDKYNPLPLLRMIRFIPFKYSPTNMVVQIVRKNEFYRKLVKNPLEDYLHLKIEKK